MNSMLPRCFHLAMVLLFLCVPGKNIARGATSGADAVRLSAAAESAADAVRLSPAAGVAADTLRLSPAAEIGRAHV